MQAIVRFLHHVSPIVRTWYGVGAFILAVVGGIYYGVPRMAREWEWWRRGHDEEVLTLVGTDREVSDLSYSPPVYRHIPRNEEDIAAELGRSRRSVDRSVARLARQGKVVCRDGKWKKG